MNTGSGANSANHFNTEADSGANSALVTCTGPAGAVSMKSKLLSDAGGKYLKLTAGTYSKMGAMCKAGVLTVTVRNWINKNAASPYALDYNCVACSKDCTPAASMTTPGTNDVVAAVVANVKGTLNLAGAGT